MKIAFVAPPYAGHLNTLLFFARAAQARGHGVEVITGPGKIAQVRALDLPAHCPPLLEGGLLEAMPETPGATFRNPFRLLSQMRQSVGLLAPLRDHLAARWTADRPDVVVADFIALPAGLAAQALGIPWVTMAAPAFVLETRSGPPSYMGGLQPGRGTLGRWRDRAGWALMSATKSALFALHGAAFRRLGLSRLRPDGTEAVYSPDAILCPGLRKFEFATRWPPAVSFLGPVPFTPDTLPAPPGDGPRPRVLVTFGTHVPWAKARMIAQTCRLATRLPGVQFEISRGESARAADPPEELAPNVTLRGFIPYTAELARLDAVIHHCGAGIAAACIAAGLPQLVCPRDYDQPDCAARVAHHGLGHRIRRLDSASTAERLAAILRTAPPGVARMQAAAARYDPETLFFARLDALLSRPECSPCP